MAQLTFEELRQVSFARAQRWHPRGIEEWSLSDWGVAMAGEAGEVCDAIKKYNRLRDKIQQTNGAKTMEAAIEDIGMEIGDTAIYLDLLARRAGTTLEECIRKTFNRVSEREGFPERL